MKRLIYLSVFVLLAGLGMLFNIRQAQAADSIGMHVLRPQELEQVAQQYADLRQESNLTPLFITLPFTLNDVDNLQPWQDAFNLAKQQNIVPIVRLSTRFDAELNAWIIPNRYQMMQLMTAVDHLPWPQPKRHIILFNETNHAPEWGGQFNEQNYRQLAETLTFMVDWLHTEDNQYVVLPPAMDLAAGNTSSTREAFDYWRELLTQEPNLLTYFDGWNSHSYPNPGFSASPYRDGKNSLRGYQHELAWLAQYSDRSDWSVYITETGWQANFSENTLRSYYSYSLQNIWNDGQIVAVTPFLFAGAPGPFAGFSFVDEAGQPTKHWQALVFALQQQAQRLLSYDN